MIDPASTATVALEGLAPGTLVAGRFEVRALLGEGGMGTVYRALDRELDELVALKTLRRELASNPVALGRFRREVSLARRVTHPNVARTFDLGSHGETRFLTMELITGTPLSARSSGAAAALALPEALRVATEVARGLAAAHAAGVVHRDLKPDNVILAGERVVITDFGIARLADERGGGGGGAGPAREALATGGTIVGTPAYMAPEQVQAYAVDGRADVYALGIVLYELLAARLPFAGDTPIAQAAARLVAPAPDVRSAGAAVPEAVAKLVAAMLATAREARPDAQTVLEQLERLRGGGAAGSPAGLFASGARDSIAPAGAASLEFSLGALDEPAVSTIAVRAFDGGGVGAEPAGAAAALAADVERAVRDAIAGERSMRLLDAPAVTTTTTTTPLTAATPASVASSHTLAADATVASAALVLEGSARVQADGRARVRVRLLDRTGAAVWTERIDGAASASFELEDAVAARVLEALRAHAANRASRGDGGPSEPGLRARYEPLRRISRGIDPGSQREAIAGLEALHAEAPDDPWIASLLATSLCKLQRQIGALDDAAFARAEDLALRAIASPEAPAQAFHAVALVRFAHADYRAALRAELEALRRAPRMAEAHYGVGGVLCQAGRTPEGMARLRLATRYDPSLPIPYIELGWHLAVLGERAKADAALREAEARSGQGMVYAVRVRLPFLWSDRALAAETAEGLARAKLEGATWEHAQPLLAAYAKGERAVASEAALAHFSSERVAARPRAVIQGVAIEYFCAIGDVPRALEVLEAATHNAGMVDLNWLDHGPVLAVLRDTPAFARARAVVAARSVQILGGA